MDFHSLLSAKIATTTISYIRIALSWTFTAAYQYYVRKQTVYKYAERPARVHKLTKRERRTNILFPLLLFPREFNFEFWTEYFGFSGQDTGHTTPTIMGLLLKIGLIVAFCIVSSHQQICTITSNSDILLPNFASFSGYP